MKRTAHAVWNGSIQKGNGKLELGSKAFKGSYSFASRFQHSTEDLENKIAGSRLEEENLTNPEELIGAAHAGCFSMALSLFLGEAGYNPDSIDTEAEVNIEKQGGGFAITSVHLKTKAKVPNIDASAFNSYAEQAKDNCPVSQALSGTKISLEAELL
ncbi:MAG: OsmC family protein [Spirochaetia bacterium]